MDYNRPDAGLLLATIGQRTQQGTEVLKKGILVDDLTEIFEINWAVEIQVFKLLQR